MDKEKERFVQAPQGITMVFIPQCCRCEFNIDYFSCLKFDEKPVQYKSNSVDCPCKVAHLDRQELV